MVQYYIKGSTGFQNVHLVINPQDPNTAPIHSFLEQIPQLTGSDTTTSDSFGFSFDLSNNFLVVGVPSLEKAYVFERQNSTSWVQVTQLDGHDLAEAGEQFGFSVAVSNERIVIGAPYRQNNRGAIYVFHRDILNNWIPDREELIEAPDHTSETQSLFGYSLSLEGTTLAVGAPHAFANNSPNNNGAVYLYNTHMGSRLYTFITKIISPNPQPNSEFGSVLDLDGEHVLAIGSPKQSINTGSIVPGAGVVHIYYRTSDTVWSYATELYHPASEDNMNFGSALSFKASRLVVGAPFKSNGGEVYYYTGHGDSWNFTMTLTVGTSGATIDDPLSSSENQLGISVDQDPAKNLIFVGSPGFNQNRGAVFIFEMPGDTWKGSLVPKLTKSGGMVDDNVGKIIRLDSESLVVLKLNGTDGTLSIWEEN